MDISLEWKIVVSQKRFTNGHLTIGGEEEDRRKNPEIIIIIIIIIIITIIIIINLMIDGDCDGDITAKSALTLWNSCYLFTAKLLLRRAFSACKFTSLLLLQSAP